MTPKIWLSSIALLFLLPTPVAGWANFSQALILQDEARLNDQRQAHQQAIEQLYQGDRQRFQEAVAALQDYPLYPYLKYREYKRYMNAVSTTDVEQYGQQFGNTPYANILRQRWIKNLAYHQRWDEFLAHYEPGNYGAEFDCYYYWAQYKNGNRSLAFNGASQLWLVGHSQHEACDPLFEVWKTTGAITNELAWKRTQLAIDNNRLQLARYLERFLTPEQKSLSSEWRRVVRTPSRIQQFDRYLQLGEAAKPIVITALSRLIRQDPELAQELWQQYLPLLKFNPSEQAQISYDFAFVLGIRRQPNARFWLDQAATFPANHEIIPIGIRHALYEQDWHRARRWIALLQKDAAAENAWQYWLTRTEQWGALEVPETPVAVLSADQQLHLDAFHQQFLAALGNEDKTLLLMPASVLAEKFQPPQDPMQRLESLAQQRDFYGFLASESLRRPLALNQQVRPKISNNLHRIASLDAVQRAKEFYWHGDAGLATLEWNGLVRSLDADQRSDLAQLANLWGWYQPAIVAAYRSDAYNDLAIRFPMAYSPLVAKHAATAGVDVDWVYSVIRQESAFLPHARSPVGAMGMMQLMPNTARQVSKELGLPVANKKALLTPDLNVKLGTSYMSQLLAQFNGNIILATAAYNAGPHRAEAWQPDYLPVRGDLWIETIPFHETRDYVKKILTYQAIYRSHMGLEAQLSEALNYIPPKALTNSMLLQ